MERKVIVKQHSYIQRSYFSAGRIYSRLFAAYFYKGVPFHRYVLEFYYPSDFYSWLESNWGVPAQYVWPWVGSPWYGPYAVYFTPDGVYYNGYSWLTDYYLGQTMAEDYLQQEAAPDQSTSDASAPADVDQVSQDTVSAETATAISPDVKAAIVGEVQHELVYGSAAASGAGPSNLGELPSDLKPNYVFVVASGIDVSTSDQQTCGLGPGDVLRLLATPDSNATAAVLIIVAGKRGDCPASTRVTVALQDLQDMLNNMRAQIDSGLRELRARQGKAGLPAAPASAMSPPRPAMTDVPPPVEDDVAALLSAQQGQTTRVEADVVGQAFPQ